MVLYTDQLYNFCLSFRRHKQLHAMGPTYQALVPFVVANGINGQAMLLMHHDMQQMLLADPKSSGETRAPTPATSPQPGAMPCMPYQQQQQQPAMPQMRPSMDAAAAHQAVARPSMDALAVQQQQQQQQQLPTEEPVLKGRKSDWGAQLRGLMNMMRAQPGAAELQAQGVRAIIEAVAGQVEMDALLLTNDACTSVAAAMHAVPADLHLQRHCCTAVAALCSGGAERREKLASCGACEGVLAAFRNFPTEPAVQLQACTALAALITPWRGEGALDTATASAVTLGNAVKLTQAGGCPGALTALLTHTGRADVQCAALWAINCLLTEPSCCTANRCVSNEVSSVRVQYCVCVIVALETAA
jgi:hypothetical protein